VSVLNAQVGRCEARMNTKRAAVECEIFEEKGPRDHRRPRGGPRPGDRDLGAGWALDTKIDYDGMHALRRRYGARASPSTAR